MTNEITHYQGMPLTITTEEAEYVVGTYRCGAKSGSFSLRKGSRFAAMYPQETVEYAEASAAQDQRELESGRRIMARRAAKAAV